MKRIIEIKTIILLLGFILQGTLTVKSQILQQFTMWNQNHYLLNPAAAGNIDHLDIAVGYRQQWAGVSDAPSSYYATAHTVLNKPQPFEKSAVLTAGNQDKLLEVEKRRTGLRHAIGGQLLNGENGAFQRNEVLLTYALHLPVTKTIYLSFGLTAGLSNYGFDETKAAVLLDNDPVYNAYVNGSNSNLLNVNSGVYLYSDRFFVGYAAHQLLQNQLDIADIASSNPASVDIQHYITGGYHFDASNDFRFTPNVLIKQLGSNPLSYDLGLTLSYRKRVSAGLSFRSEDAVSAILGLKFNHFMKAGYAYDFTTSDIRNESSGSHEIFIGFTLF